MLRCPVGDLATIWGSYREETVRHPDTNGYIPSIVQADVKHYISTEEEGKYMTTWDAQVYPHHAITQQVAGVKGHDVVMGSAVEP